MKLRIWSFMKGASLAISLMSIVVNSTFAQNRQEPGHSIGTVTTQGNLIVMTLNEGALGHANLFDLSKRTLRFTPEASGYRSENLARLKDRWRTVDSIRAARAAVTEADDVLRAIEREACDRSEAARIACGFDD